MLRNITIIYIFIAMIFRNDIECFIFPVLIFVFNKVFRNYLGKLFAIYD